MIRNPHIKLKIELNEVINDEKFSCIDYGLKQLLKIKMGEHPWLKKEISSYDCMRGWSFDFNDQKINRHYPLGKNTREGTDDKLGY